MPDFYVLSARDIENAETVAAAGERHAAKKYAELEGITAGRVAVIPAESVVFKTVDSTTTVEVSD